MIKLKNTPEQAEIIRAIGSKKLDVSGPASQAFAGAIGKVIGEVIDQAGTASLIYSEGTTFAEDESPSYPLDFLYNEDAGYISIWSQEIAGGLPSSEVASAGELKISTYKLHSATNFLKKYARKSDFNILSKAVNRMLQEVLIKVERMAWAPVLRALGEALTKINGVPTDHIITSTTQNRLQVDDFSRLLTLAKRLGNSFAGGTPVNAFSKGITDLFMSAEMKEQIRGFSYQPMNTVGVPNSDESTALGLPDSIRERIFNNAGMESIFDINVTDINELGLGQKYNILFGNYAPAGIAAGGANFNTSTDEVLVGVDVTKDACIRAVGIDEEGSKFSVDVDNQWTVRDDRAGYYGSLSEGRIILDARALAAIIV